MMQSHVFEGHGGRIFSIALCQLSDGRRIAASASHDRTVKIWSINDYQLLYTIEYSDFVWRVFIVVDPKPLVIAFVSTEDKIQVSDLLTGATENIFYGRLIFAGIIPTFHTPTIITSIGEEDLGFVDVTTGEVLRVIKGGFEKAFRAVVSTVPVPTLVFTTWNAQNRRSTIQTYDLQLDNYTSSVVERDRNKMSLMFEGDSRDGVTSLVITKTKNPLICSGHYDSTVRLWCIENKQLLRILEGHQDYVGSVAAWRGTQPLVVSGSSDGTIRVWNAHTGELVAIGEGHMRDVWAVAVTHGPSPFIVSGSFDRTVRLWSIQQLLAEQSWQRRKHFCLMIHPVLKGKMKNTEELNQNMLKAFHVQSLCSHIASFI